MGEIFKNLSIKDVKNLDNRNDQDFHDKALVALAHYYRYRDHSALNRIVCALPKSNRRIAMISWIHNFTCLRWDFKREVLVRTKNPEMQNIVEAKERPFWIFKVGIVRRRHVSGGEFDPDYFFEKVVSNIRSNIDRLPLVQLESVILELQKILNEKRSR